jgi:stress response protein SCP2
LHFKKALKVLENEAKRLIELLESKVKEREITESLKLNKSQKEKNIFKPNIKNAKKLIHSRRKKIWAPNNIPEMILSIISKIMNTQVVLLCDNGIATSDAALSGYCHLHRLLLAIIDYYPELKSVVKKRLSDFTNDPNSRVKSSTPSLGEFLTYLSVSDSHSWKQISMIYLMELFDRSILWSCTKDPTLAQVKEGNIDRLDKYLETQRVSMRLTLFHVVFLNLLVRGGGSSANLDDCKDRYDTFQGRPPMYLRREFQKQLKNILSFKSWPEFFELSQIPLPSKTQLLSILEKAVFNSIAKGYHSKDTVFQDVMKSGVSRILLKGETYTAAPNLNHIQLHEKWRFDGSVVYLDASCLIYDFHDKNLGIVDYATRQWSCIRHSGDVIRNGEGQHTIDIEIPKIYTTIKALFFTVSAWTTTLQAISQPTCHLHDVDNDYEMCRYKLEGTNTGNKTAVIMCKLHRFSPSSRWELTTIGHVGFGRAGNYTSIKEDIKRFL